MFLEQYEYSLQITENTLHVGHIHLSVSHIASVTQLSHFPEIQYSCLQNLISQRELYENQLSGSHTLLKG